MILNNMDIEAIRKMVIDAMSGDDHPACMWWAERDLRRIFGDEVVDAGLADGTISVYDLEDDDE